MLSQMSNNAILTKARAMYGRRLMPEHYRELLNRRSVSEIAAYLKGHETYSKTLQGTQENLIHRGLLENLLRRDVLRRYMRLARYDAFGSKGFYSYYLINIEAEQILACLRLMNSGLVESYIETLPGYLRDYLSFDVLQLARARSYDDVLEVLEKTEYYRVLLPMRPAPGQRPDLFACEFALRQYFYDKTFALIDRYYRGEPQKQLRELFTMQMELGNISSIYRLKRYFHAEPEVIEKRILKSHNPRFDRRMQALITARTPDDVLAILNRDHRHNVYSAGGGFAFIEHANQARRYAVNRRYIAYSVHPSVVFVAYIILSQIEVDNLVSIIEGVRYKLPQGEIEKLLVM